MKDIVAYHGLKRFPFEKLGSERSATPSPAPNEGDEQWGEQDRKSPM